jgi:hypothetical protein
MKLLDTILGAILWVFEGIGVMILGLVVRFFYKKRKPKNKDKNPPKGDNYSQKVSLCKSHKNNISQTINN